MEHVPDTHAILQTLFRFTQAQDRLDLDTMASSLVPNQTIKFDLTKHFPEVGVLQGTAAEICGILYEASAGWTATQHPVYNPVLTFNDDPSKAQVTAMVQAYHCLEADGVIESLTVYAVWHVEMQKVHGKWVISGMAMERDISIANVGLFEKMRARMGKGGKRLPLGGRL